MADTLTAPPPAAPSGAGALGNAPIGFNTIPTTPAFSRASKALDKLAGIEEKPAPKPQDKATDKQAEKTTEVKPNDVQPITDKKPEAKSDSDDGLGEPASKTGEDAPQGKDTTTDKPKRPNPWKMLDEEKANRARIEKEYSEYKAKAGKPQDDPEKKQYAERLTALEKENAELKEQHKFHAYEHSDEYRAQFEKPYFDAWQSGREWVARLNVTDQNGAERRATAQDFDQIMDMAFSNPEQASAALEQMFGNKASSVAAYIVDVQKAARRASDAIETFRKTGAEQMKQKTESAQRQQKEIAEHISQTWTEANKLAAEHPEYGEYFKPREGDQDWNQRLAKGKEMAQRAFQESPFDPKLTPEQRKAIVQRHAAVLNRAAAFGALRHENAKLKQQLKDRDEALAAYEESEPKPGEANGRQTTPANNGGRALDRAMAALESGNYRRA